MTDKKPKKQYPSRQRDNLYVREIEPGKRYSIYVVFPASETLTNERIVSKTRRINAKDFEDAFEQASVYREQLRGEIPDLTETTLAQYVQRWFELQQTLGKWTSKSTVDRSRSEIKRIKQYFPGVLVRNVTPALVREGFLKMAEDGVGKYSVARTFKTLSRILDEAVYDDAIRKNPCARIDITEPERDRELHESKIIPKETAIEFVQTIRVAKRTPKIVAVYIGLYTGARRGEVLALTWRDIDVESKTLSITKQYTKHCDLNKPKASSTRNIHMEAPLIAYLQAWKGEQKRWLEARGYEQTEDTPICCNTRGLYIHPDGFNRWRRKFYADNNIGHFESEKPYIDTAGHDRVRRTGYVGPDFHSLRRLQATLLLAEGIDPKTIMARMGWKKDDMLLEVYAEFVSANDAAAASKIADIFSS